MRILSRPLFLLLLCIAFLSKPPCRLPAQQADAPAANQTESKIGDPGVTAPALLSAPPPQFTDKARQAAISGSVLIGLTLEPDGTTSHVRVMRGIGYGLDEKALEAVRQYKFRPAMKDGVPVAVKMNIVVNFQIKQH